MEILILDNNSAIIFALASVSALIACLFIGMALERIVISYPLALSML
jgi:hypothetical protein